MIYCLEDDESSRELMVYTLNAAGFSARGFGRADEFWDAIAEKKPELVLLDIMLPDEDGISVLKKLRRHTSTAGIPVIMASAKGTEYDKVLGLDLGADDYLAKPFGMMELISRVKAVLRRSGDASSDVLHVGQIELDPDAHTVTVKGKNVVLTPREFSLLALLMSGVGRAYTRQQLLDLVWETDYAGETRTVDVHVGTLRTKLGDEGSHIRTIRGVGYKMEE